MEQTCRKCGKTTGDGSQRCLCDRDLTNAGTRGSATKVVPAPSTMAMASWLCPLLAWGSQSFLALTLGGISMPAAFWLLMALVQLLLMLAGLGLGIRVMLFGKAVPRGTWISGLMGVILSGGTLLFVAGVMVFEGI